MIEEDIFLGMNSNLIILDEVETPCLLDEEDNPCPLLCTSLSFHWNDS